ncbi:hypothetical protein NDU88_006392 [Pleurodeles waltl]|uniref:Uncharacterized protein n=1 Tax=Pleurodeles waltl TaxID=8319 RepID=A0AAV7UKV8_PLEWA|nr:hypothetical protein NDU88_006392 [Pleurodeles waltl]
MGWAREGRQNTSTGAGAEDRGEGWPSAQNVTRTPRSGQGTAGTAGAAGPPWLTRSAGQGRAAELLLALLLAPSPRQNSKPVSERSRGGCLSLSRNTHWRKSSPPRLAAPLQKPLQQQRLRGPRLALTLPQPTNPRREPPGTSVQRPQRKASKNSHVYSKAFLILLPALFPFVCVQSGQTQKKLRSP